MMKKMMVEETRKGPWTEQEDVQLAYFVRILGERRWDFVAKVSGLKRTGKSCRLRWVNYLHPGLKRGRMTPEEERLVLDLHSIWGNRWSRIARKLPGRTDNEIKNYWRTHMRKKAQERKRTLSSSSSSSSICSTSASDPMQDDSSQDPKTEEASMKEQGSREEISEVEVGRGYSMDQIWNEIASTEEAEREEKGSLKPSIRTELASLVSTNKTTKDEGSFQDKGDYSMDQIWEEIASPDEVTSGQGHETCKEKVCSFNSTSPVMVCPDLWDYYSDSLWSLNEREIRMLTPINDPVVSYFGHG